MGSGDAARSTMGAFDSADLDGADLDGADLDGAGLDGADLDGSAGGGLEVLRATDSRRGRVEAAVVAGCVGACSGAGRAMISGDLFGSTGDGWTGVACRLASFVSDLLTLGVLGPAGASGTWTVLVDVSDNGAGVWAVGVWATGV